MSTTEIPETGDAYALLSKPTLQLSDAEIEVICVDLRKRRERFLMGQKDAAPKKAAAPKVKLDESPEAKKQRSADLLGDIGNLF